MSNHLIHSDRAIVGARHRYIRQSQGVNPIDPESLVGTRGFVGVISRSEVEKLFPLVNYTAWWTSRHQHEADPKEIGKRHSTVSDNSQDDDPIGHREDNTPGDHSANLPETDGHIVLEWPLSIQMPTKTAEIPSPPAQRTRALCVLSAWTASRRATRSDR